MISPKPNDAPADYTEARSRQALISPRRAVLPECRRYQDGTGSCATARQVRCTTWRNRDMALVASARDCHAGTISSSQALERGMRSADSPNATHRCRESHRQHEINTNEDPAWATPSSPGTALSATQTGRDDGVKALPLDEWHPESQRITPQPHGYVPDRLEVNVFPFPIHIYMSRLLALVQTTSPKPSPLKSPVVAIT